MEKHFVTYKQALALKELGFDEPCLSVFYSSLVDTDEDTIKFILEYTESQYYAQKGYVNGILRPLKSQVFEWLRDKHNFIGVIGLFSISDQGISSFEFHVDKIHYIGPSNFQEFVGFKTYEEAESDCIDKLIEIVKSNKV